MNNDNKRFVWSKIVNAIIVALGAIASAIFNNAG